jgi:hypothetical protein
VALVAAVAPHVESRLSASVLANRVAHSSIDPPGLRLASWRAERAAFRAALSELGAASAWLVFADVRDCYGSIAPGVVAQSLGSLGCRPSDVWRVETFLRGLAESGTRGLPVGPDPSAVLANAVLMRVDRALEQAGVAHLRWVDDVVAAARGPRDADDILELLRASLAGLSLELNGLKTRVVAGATARTGNATTSMESPRAVLG